MFQTEALESSGQNSVPVSQPQKFFLISGLGFACFITSSVCTNRVLLPFCSEKPDFITPCSFTRSFIHVLRKSFTGCWGCSGG